MKRTLTVSLVALFLSSVLSNVAAGRNAVADPVQTIRQQYAAINKGLTKYKKVKKKLSGFSLEGGDLVAYLDGPAVVKIVANHYGEGGKATEEYYYWKGKLIFVYRKDYHYDKPMSGKVVRTEENRFYFDNGRLIRWINESGKPVASDTTEYQQKQDENLETSNKFLEGARSKNFTIEG
jgi:hypothetical protein